MEAKPQGFEKWWLDFVRDNPMFISLKMIAQLAWLGSEEGQAEQKVRDAIHNVNERYDRLGLYTDEDYDNTPTLLKREDEIGPGWMNQYYARLEKKYGPCVLDVKTSQPISPQSPPLD